MTKKTKNRSERKQGPYDVEKNGKKVSRVT